MGVGATLTPHPLSQPTRFGEEFLIIRIAESLGSSNLSITGMAGMTGTAGVHVLDLSNFIHAKKLSAKIQIAWSNYMYWIFNIR